MAATKLTPVYPSDDHPTAVVKDIQENYSTGYISLFRSIREHWIWQDPVKFQWWIDILMECNHADKKVAIGFELLECKRGQTLHSLLEWSKRWRVDISTVRRFLKVLHSDGMIVPEPLSKTTRITVCNYDSYQQKRHDKDTPRKGEANAGHTPRNTNNNANNDNNVNKDTAPAEKWVYSHNGFFDLELKNNASQSEVEKYKTLIDFIHGFTEGGIKLEKVLALKSQISYKQYLTLRKTYGEHKKRTIQQVLENMEGKADLTKKYDSAFWVVNNWLKNDFDKK